MPFRAATPKSTIKPTDAGTDRYKPVIQSEKTPPINAKGKLVITNRAILIDLNVIYNSNKIKPMATGRIMSKRVIAFCWFSNCPPQLK